MDSEELNPSLLSDRQTVLRRLWETRGRDEVLSIMKSSHAARDEALVEDLIAQIEEVARHNNGAASQLAQTAECIATVHGLADSLSKVRSLEDIVDWYRLEPSFAFSHRLACVFGAMKVDADRRGDHELSLGLRQGLRMRRSLGKLALQANRLRGLAGPAIFDAIDQTPELRSDTFHSWLQLLAAAGGREDGERVRELLNGLTAATKRWHSIQRLKVAEPGAPVSGYLSPEEAAIWYVRLPEDLVAKFLELADLVASGGLSLEEAKEQAVDAAEDLAPGPEGRAIITTHLLEFVLHQSRPTLAAEVIEMYERAVEEPSLRGGHPQRYPTKVLHFAIALLQCWRNLSDPRRALTELTAKIAKVLPDLDPSVAPRLTSDLLFAKARAHENLGAWDAQEYKLARADYEAGLDIKGARGEREARGRALADLANTIQRIPPEDPAERDSRIVSLFEEAVRCLGGLRWSLASVSLNFAIYLNERSVGDWRTNQERARSLSEQAVRVVDENLESDSPPSARETAGAAYLTFGNVLRAQAIGGLGPRLEQARDAYLKGLEVVGHAGTVRGLLRLNLAQTYRQLYDLQRSASDLDNSHYSMLEAEELLASDPTAEPQVLLQRAEMALSPPQGTAPDHSETVAHARAALSLFRASGSPRLVARANGVLAKVLSASPEARTDAELQEAVLNFAQANAGWKSLGDLDGLLEGLYDAAAVLIALFARSGDPSDLKRGMEILEESARVADEMWLQSESFDWRVELSDAIGGIRSDLAWCRAQLGTPAKDVLVEATRAKANQFASDVAMVGHAIDGSRSESVSRYLDGLRRRGRQAELVSRSSEHDSSTSSGASTALEESERTLAQLAWERRLVDARGDDPDANARRAIDEIQQAWPNGVLLDFTVSRFGTVVIVGHADALKTHLLPTKRSDVRRWMTGADGWLSRYAAYRSSKTQEDRLRWAEATDLLLQTVQERLVDPIQGDLSPHGGSHDLLIVPGALAGVPVHAARTPSTAPLFQGFQRAIYLPTLGVVRAAGAWPPPRQALCILSDPGEGKVQLASAPSEVAAVAATLAGLGAHVEIIASVGPTSGMKVFTDRGLALPPGVTVLEERPTRQWLRQHVADWDHIFFSGHGRVDGLVLVDAEGKEAPLSALEVLELPALGMRPTVVLSACDTSHETGGLTSELFSAASCFLRIGARTAIGTLWVVRDPVAEAFSRALYENIQRGQDPLHAYRLAVEEIRASGVGDVLDWAPFAALATG